MNAVEKRQNFIKRNHNLIVSLYPNTRRVYGPYLAKDGRYRVVLYDGKSRKTRQYAKLKMEIKLCRRIHEPETVDHNDQNKRNDRYDNLVLRNRAHHARLDVKRVKKLSVRCVWCKNYFKASPRNRKSTTAGPFCSKACVGKYAATVTHNGRKLPPKKKMETKYYTLKMLN